MNRFTRSLAIASLAALVPIGATWAAPSSVTKHAVLQVTSKFKHTAGFAHASATAKLRYTKGDVFITVTAAHLPKPSTLGKRAYVVFATDGAMTDRVGALTTHGAMSGVTGEVMMTKVQDLNVYAVGASNSKRPNGTQVLSGMIG